MSRPHNAEVEGGAQVRLVCDVCGKTAWSNVIALRSDDTCIEYEAVRFSKTWDYADDALVCSEECYRAVFE